MRGTRAVPLVLTLVAALGLGLPGCRRAPAGAGTPLGQRAQARYRCPMHPSYVSDTPGSCPICGMTLLPIEPGPGGAAAPPVAGRIAITINPERRQFLGVRSEPLSARPLTRTIRTVGRVTVDERRLHHVHTKFEGYVEHLHVDFTGKLVRKGEPLLSIFSPELVATQQEYVLAYRAQRELAGSGIASLTAGTADLLEAARRRLLLWDIRAEDIERLERTGEVERTLDLHAEIGGYVVQKNVYHGMRVMPADTLFDIADLSRLWVLADVYESDLPSVQLGMRARLELPYLPGRVWTGTVTNVAPTVEEKTRTIKLRVEVANQDDALKPDMFADVFLQADLGHGVAVPESALIRSGDRTLVFLDRGEGRFEPREVSIGSPVNGSFQVLWGLAAGDRVVTSANFLIDSESSLRAAIAGMSSGEQSSAPAHQH